MNNNEEVFAALTEMLDQDRINLHIYYKGLIALSYEYILEGDEQRAIEILLIPPEQYYTDIQPVQLMGDDLYRDVMVRLGTWLKENEHTLLLKTNVPSAYA